jgi:hypothetical protein
MTAPSAILLFTAAAPPRLDTDAGMGIHAISADIMALRAVVRTAKTAITVRWLHRCYAVAEDLPLLLDWVVNMRKGIGGLGVASEAKRGK